MCPSDYMAGAITNTLYLHNDIHDFLYKIILCTYTLWVIIPQCKAGLSDQWWCLSVYLADAARWPGINHMSTGIRC